MRITFNKFVQQGVMTPLQRELLQQAVAEQPEAPKVGCFQKYIAELKDIAFEEGQEGESFVFACLIAYVLIGIALLVCPWTQNMVVFNFYVSVPLLLIGIYGTYIFISCIIEIFLYLKYMLDKRK